MTFVKGKSGNPKGPPVANFSLVRLLKERMQSIPNGQKEIVAMKAIDQYMKHIEEGKPEILKDAFDRIDGKPVQRTDLTSAGEKILTADAIIAAIDSAKK